MGMLPAPTIANLYVVVYNCKHILPLLLHQILGPSFVREFINNGFGGSTTATQF